MRLNSIEIKKHIKCYTCKYVEWHLIYYSCIIHKTQKAKYIENFGWNYIIDCHYFEEDWIKIIKNKKDKNENY